MRKASDNSQEEKKKTILVVDDESLMVETLRLLLQKAGYRVVAAADAQSGWREYVKAKPDLVLTDLAMPGQKGRWPAGIELLQRIRKEDVSTPVVIITGWASLVSAVEAIKLGADDYISKPFELGKLRDRIKELLGKDYPELIIRRMKHEAALLAKENERLVEKIKGLSAERGGKRAHNELEKYRAICGSVAHTLKGEFMHLGHSIREVRERASSSPDIVEECDMMGRSVAYSEILLRRLLDYLDLGKASIVSVNTFEILQKTESLVRPRLPSSIQLEVEIDGNVRERVVSVNIEQLMGVLLELIQNAVNALREKGGTIELMLQESDGKIGISVKDNGPGIPQRLRKTLFKKQVTSKSGLGLGLFLCSKVVAELGGKLSLQTSSQKGTIFTILLPIANREKES